MTSSRISILMTVSLKPKLRKPEEPRSPQSTLFSVMPRLVSGVALSWV